MFFIKQVIAYARFRYRCFYLHGIHSPFIFEFARVIKDNTNKNGYLELLRFRESVKNNNTLLTIEDHGAGSRVFKTNTRKVSELLRYNSTSLERTKLLYRIVQHYQPRNILELGTSLGIGSHAMAMASSSTRIITVEGAAMVAAFTANHLEKNQITNVSVVHATFKDYMPTLTGRQFDLIYIDGHHDGNALVNYFEDLLELCHNETIIIADDINWSSSMQGAWNKIQDHPMVTASINTFDWGILFLRKEQRQERFYVHL
ncbi:MAG: class I SAM-dependent methyltransferase [Nonlabens sp.]